MNPNQDPNDTEQADDQRKAARQELHRTLRDQYEHGLAEVDDPDLVDQPATTHQSVPLKNDWQPATSKPGETLTVEGQIRSVGTFAAGLRNNDPRLQPYRRNMNRTGLVFVAIGLAVVTLAILIDTLW